MEDVPRKKRKLGAGYTELNGIVEGTEPRISKDERREAKRLKKAKKTTENDFNHFQPENVTVLTEKDLKAKKAARKAEKARRKAEKAARDSAKSEISEDFLKADATAEEARDRAQAQKEARTRMIVNGIGNKVKRLAVPVQVKLDEVEVKLKEGDQSDTAQAASEARHEATQTGKQQKGRHKVKEPKMVPSLNDHEAEIVIGGEKAGHNNETGPAAVPRRAIEEILSLNHINIDDPAPALSSNVRPMLDFKHLPQSVRESQPDTLFKTYNAPTPIQAAAWPYLLARRDVVGIAETGSGKTLAFGIPCVQAVRAFQTMPKRSIGAVIVSPTRELASQIHFQLEPLAQACSLRTVCLFGGMPKDPQRDVLKKAHIVVATPGRLNDFVEEGSAKLKYVKYLVLDEADRMLDQGFKDAIQEIISKCAPSSKGRQTSMFTATWPQSVRELAATFMSQPVQIRIGADNPNNELRANRNVKQVVEVLDSMAKEGRLRELVREYSPSNHFNTTGMKDNRILIFCLYKKECDRIEKMLRKMLSGAIKGIGSLHGDMSQPLRTASIQEFKKGNLPVLVATDVAARGLDIPDVKLVINYTFPLTAEDYVHRIGRTGRAGKEGLSITLFTDHDKARAGELVNVLRAADQKIPEELLKYDLTVKKKDHEVYGKFYREPREGEKTKGTMTVL